MNDREFLEDADFYAMSSDEVKSQQVVAEDMREHNMWREVMNDENGARVLRKILEKTGIYRTTYVRGDQYETAFREGGRNVGLWLLSKMSEADQWRTSEILNSNMNEREK